MAHHLFRDPNSALRSVGSALVTIGSPIVCICTLVLAASLGHAYQDSMICSGSGNDDDNVLSIDHDTQSAVPTEQPHEVGRFSLPGKTVIFVFVFCRLVLVPAVGFGIVHFLASMQPALTGGTNTLVKLTILVQFALPSAQFVVMVLASLGRHTLSSQLAFLYVFQYATALFTLTFFTTLAMSMAGL